MAPRTILAWFDLTATDMFAPFFTRRILFSILLGFCLLVLIVSFRTLPQYTYRFKSSPPLSVAHETTGHATSNHRCDAFPNSSDTLIIVKTGANEIYDKLPTQLLTALQCSKNGLIFSDMEQDIGPYHVYDALDNVTEAAKLHNADFDYYRTLHEYQLNGQDISTLRETTGQAAWDLDKYKFLHMLEKSWNMRPGLKWYVFIEADTYLVWSNLLLWLERLDPSEALYLGSPTYVNNEAFAHGGSGIVLSGTALSKFVEGDQGVASRYDMAVRNEQFGDYVLMKALRDKGVEFGKRWPMLQAEKPTTIPFGPGPDNGVRHWCQPIVTMHHMSPDEVSSMWRYEQQRTDVKQPLLIQELYQYAMSPYLSAEREDWYNLSDDVIYRPPGVDGGRRKSPEDMSSLEKNAYMSFEHCGEACDEQPDCFQYVYYEQTCGFSQSYRLGRRRLPESGVSYKSGWNLAKIAQNQADNACLSPEWLHA